MKDFSQCQKVLGFLRLRGSITPLQAIQKFWCYRLGARIHELRGRGYTIGSQLVKSKNGKHYAKYTLIVDSRYS